MNIDFKKIAEMADKSEDLRDKVLIRFFCQTGCTPKEASLVKLEDVDVKKCLVKIISRDKERISQISEELAKEIALLIVSEKPVKYLFSNIAGRNISTKRMRQIVEEESTRLLGMKITPMQIRYAHIIDAMEYGIPLSEIQQQTGLEAKDILDIINNKSD